MRIAQRCQAGRDAPVVELIILQPAFQHGAGPAIPFTASDFCSGKVLPVPDKIQQRRPWGQSGFNKAVIQDKTDHAGQGWVFAFVQQEYAAKNTII